MLLLLLLLTDDSYSHLLWPSHAAGTNCTNGKPNGPPGVEVLYDETIDINLSALNAGKATDCLHRNSPA